MKSCDHIIESKKGKKKTTETSQKKEYYKVFREHVRTGLKVSEYGIKQDGKIEQQKN